MPNEGRLISSKVLLTTPDLLNDYNYYLGVTVLPCSLSFQKGNIQQNSEAESGNKWLKTLPLYFIGKR